MFTEADLENMEIIIERKMKSIVILLQRYYDYYFLYRAHF